MDWCSSSLVKDKFLSIIAETLPGPPSDARKIGMVEYLKNTYFDIDGEYECFSYKYWNYFPDIINGVFRTTTNASESINAAYNKSCKSGFRTTNIVAENIRSFKIKMLRKRGLIRGSGITKMNEVKSKILQRQAEIKKNLLGSFVYAY